MSEAVAPRIAARKALPETPYVGLVPYDENDAPFFFGREQEKEIVTANLRAVRLTVLYGPSGVGKSSLLLAGVVHDLRALVARHAAAKPERAPYAVCVFRMWREAPLPALVEAIRKSVVEALGGEEIPRWREDEPLIETLRSWTKRVRTLLVVLDQFEDYFLYTPEDSRADRFGSEFPQIVNEPNLRVNVLVSIREDAWAKLDRFEGAIPQLFANYVRVEHLDRHNARQAIEGPVRVWNEEARPAQTYTIEPELVDAVLDATASGDLAFAEGVRAPTEPDAAANTVEAPFLQLVMERLWRETVAAGSHALTLARLEELGGAQRIVETHLVEVLGALTRDEEAAAADAFRFLVTRSKTKIAHSASDLAEWTKRPVSALTSVLEKLCRGESGRVLRAIASPAGEVEETRYELFHDVLAEPILEWRKRYEQAREHEELAARLEAEELARRRAEEQRQRERRNRLVRIAAVGLLVLAGLLSALTAFAVVQWRDAVDLEHVGRSQRLGDLSRGSLSEDPVRAVMQAALGVDLKTTPEAVGALENALATTHFSSRLRAHKGPVFDVEFSPEGSLVATAGADGTARIWDGTGRVLQVLTGHKGAVRSVAFSDDGKRVVTAGRDGTARIWGVPGGQLFRTLRPTKRLKLPPETFVPFVGAAFGPGGNRVLMTGPDGAARVWDTETGREVLSLRGEGEHWLVNSASFSPNGDRIAIASDDATAQVWSVADHRRLATIRGHNGWVLTAVFSPDGSEVLTASEDGTVRIWNAATGKEKRRRAFNSESNEDLIEFDEDFIASAAFSPDGALVVIVGRDGKAGIWNPASGRLRRLGGARQVVGALFSPDGTRVVTNQRDGTVRIWDAGSGGDAGVLRGHNRRVYDAVFSRDGRLLLTASGDGTSIAWIVREGRLLAEPRATRRPALTGAALSPDGTAIVELTDGPALAGPLAAEGRRSSLAGEPRWAYEAAISPDGRRVATAGPDARARIWDTHGRFLDVLRGHREVVYGVTFSPDGSLLVTTGRDGTARIWNVATRRTIAVLRGRGGVFRTAFSPDGRLLVTAGLSRGGTQVWDVRSGRLLRRLRADDVYSVSFSPNGERILTASPREGTKLWSVVTGRPVALPRAFRQPAFGAAFSPDGRQVIIVGEDKLARLRSLADGGTATFAVGSQGAWSAAFSPDGRLVATGGNDGIARVWEVATRAPVAVVSLRGETVYSVRFSRDGRLLVVAGARGGHIFSLPAAKTIGVLPGPNGAVTSALVGPRGRAVVTLSEDSARLWDRLTGGSRLLAGGALDIALSRDGDRAATASNDGAVRVWQVPSGELITVLRARVKKVESFAVAGSLAFSRDGRRIAAADSDSSLVLLADVAKQKSVLLRGHDDSVNGSAFSLDGRLVVTASDDHTARIWRADSGKPAGLLRGHSASVNEAAFAPNAKLVVTASDDKTAVIWSVSRESSLRVLRGHTGEVEHAAFGAHGKLVLTTSTDGTARVWDARTGATCAILGRDPSRIVRAQFADEDGTVVTVSADGSVRSQLSETCALAVDGSLSAVARRIVRSLTPAEQRSFGGSP